MCACAYTFFLISIEIKFFILRELITCNYNNDALTIKRSRTVLKDLKASDRH